MRFPPTDVIATWPHPNYENPVNRGPALMVIELTILPLALICLGLRLYVRIRMVRQTWWDDWLMVAGAFFCCGVTISVILVLLATQLYGWNIHIWDLTYTQMVQGRKVSIAGQTIFVFASGLPKLSILASYLRIAMPGSWLWRLTWVSIILVGAAILAFLLILWLQCSPPSSYWNLLTVSRDCIPEAPPLMGQTICTVLTDFLVYVLPMPTLWKLQLPLTQRISLMVLFGFGGIVVVAGCLRTYYTHHVELETYDVTWEGFYLWVWAAVEVNLGIICGCAPALKPLLFPSMTSNGTGYNGQSSTLNTIGSSANQWRRRRNVMRSKIVGDHDDGYFDLESLKPDKRNLQSAYSSATTARHLGDAVEKFNESQESLGLPREHPSSPRTLSTAHDGHHFDFIRQQREANRDRHLNTTSWIDIGSDDDKSP
ncbi:hypothetical protein AB5N19_01536 [Seiridium cardinale]